MIKKEGRNRITDDENFGVIWQGFQVCLNNIFKKTQDKKLNNKIQSINRKLKTIKQVKIGPLALKVARTKIKGGLLTDYTKPKRELKN